MRKFLSLMILVTAALIGGCGVTTCERSEIAMGTIITLKATGSNAQAAVEESFARIAELEKNISADVRKIEEAAGAGEGVKISPDVYEILEIAQKYSELTGGAFDVTCGATVELWGIGTKNPRLPTDDELAAVKNFVGREHLHLHDGTAYLDLRGVKLNLGGVAKGYGVDLARKIFAAHGIHDGLIDFGTSTIFAVGKKKIGIKNPDNPGKLAEIVELEDCAISTSGDYEKFFIVEGRRYSHIIDPKTCAPANSEISSISVIVSNEVQNCATVADILSTTAFVTGRQRAEEIISNLGMRERKRSARVVKSVHGNFFRVVAHIPDAARTHARANSATDAFGFVADIFFNDIVTFGTQNGDGLGIVYRENFLKLEKNTTNPSILRLCMSLMSKQEFEFGVRSTKKAIAEELGIERTAAWKVFKWLKDHGSIKERKVDGQTEFLLNPDVTTCGKNRKEKIRQWQSVEPVR